MSRRRKSGNGIEPSSITKESNLEMMRRPVQGGERRVRKQENVIAMLKARKLPSERAEERRVPFDKSHDTQAEHLESVLADDKLANVRKLHEL